MNRGLIITDNKILLDSFREIVKKMKPDDWEFVYACSTKDFEEKNSEINLISIKNSSPEYFQNYTLIISLHCKQLFPDWLLKNARCINIHPGLNPHNRGWYPQIFSIINGLPIGATIHEIDSKLDHGNIIAQREVKAVSWDNSYTLYQKVLETEIALIEENLISLLAGSYISYQPSAGGNINLKKDFIQLMEFDLTKTMTGLEFINYTRAMTHNEFKNLYFIDGETNRKIYIKINLEPEI